MEFSLHRELKALFGRAGDGGSLEVRAGAYRADALTPEGAWLEVQTGPLGPLRAKLEAVLGERPVRVVKPVVVDRRITRRLRADGPDVGTRRSPRRGDPVEVFDDLVGLARLLPHPGLSIEVVAVSIDEVRIPRRRRPGYTVVDRRLRDVRGSVRLECPADLWTLIPGGAAALPLPFSTVDLEARLARGMAFAQRVAYCLRCSGAATLQGKRGNRLLYAPRID